MKNNEPFWKKIAKVTAGITALSFLGDRIEERVCDLDVELWKLYGCRSYNGKTVRLLIPYMIWVKTGVS